ncbi:hypothetical protein [Formosa sp. PL04]|uniref:hypothetical protein n=1 Tax=Formosa sp. PL04 TaxID=3081755 RepID=UPI002981E4CB|nr:hypothetical protein [Formosa sp. PL04]MDW5290316.1 hypothetical protein [Formosa sp. PL04]
MAEIKIEKKRPIWPWIIGLLVVIGIILFLFYAMSKDDNYPNDTITNEYSRTDTINANRSAIYNTTPTNDTVEHYASSATYLVKLQETLKDSATIGTDAAQTTQALKNLAYATAAKAEESNVYDTAALKNLESQLEQHTMTSDTPLDLKTMSADITAVIADIQTSRAPNLNTEVSTLKQTSEKLSASTAWAKQQNTIQDYLKQAHNILVNINS